LVRSTSTRSPWRDRRRSLEAPPSRAPTAKVGHGGSREERGGSTIARSNGERLHGADQAQCRGPHHAWGCNGARSGPLPRGAGTTRAHLASLTLSLSEPPDLQSGSFCKPALDAQRFSQMIVALVPDRHSSIAAARVRPGLSRCSDRRSSNCGDVIPSRRVLYRHALGSVSWVTLHNLKCAAPRLSHRSSCVSCIIPLSAWRSYGRSGFGVPKLK
jgi:hypothetical protein